MEIHGDMRENGEAICPDPLYGKTVVYDGDSLCQGNHIDGNWATVIGAANHMEWYNYAIGGGTIVSGLFHADGHPRHCVSRHIDVIHEKHATLDYLILDGGGNDADLLGDNEQKLGVIDPADFSGNYDDATFTGAMDALFFKALSYYPTAKIGFILLQKMGLHLPTSNRRRAYFLHAAEICRKWGVPYLDLWDGCPLNPRLRSYYDPALDVQGNRDAGKAYIDGQHLTAVGYGVISSKIEAWMRTL